MRFSCGSYFTFQGLLQIMYITSYNVTDSKNSFIKILHLYKNLKNIYSSLNRLSHGVTVMFSILADNDVMGMKFQRVATPRKLLSTILLSLPSLPLFLPSFLAKLSLETLCRHCDPMTFCFWSDMLPSLLVIWVWHHCAGDSQCETRLQNYNKFEKQKQNKTRWSR